MNRRTFLKGAGVVAAAFTLEPGQTAGEVAAAPSDDKDALLAAPCGLYCGTCDEHAAGTCHGCKCKCGKCDGIGHAEGCRINKCASGRRLDSCSKCPDMPCTALVGFAMDPIWRTHAPCIENLRRQNKIGVQAWLREQAAFWSDEQELRKWRMFGDECSLKWQDFKKQSVPEAK